MGNGYASQRRLFLGAAFANFVINFAEAGGAYPANAKNVYENADKSSPVTTVTADALGMARWYADGVYKMFIEDAAATPLWTDDNVDMTADTATEWEEDQGLAAPAAAESNLGQLFLKLNANSEFVDLMINTGDNPGFSFKTLIELMRSATPTTDSITKYPYADIRHPDFAGGAVAGSAADQSAQVQAAIDFLDGEGGGIVLVPPGTFKIKNIAVPASVKFLGMGPSSVFELYSADAGQHDHILKSENETNLEVDGLCLDGGGLGNDNKLIWIHNTGGTHIHARLNGCHFENQAASCISIYIEGSAGSPLPGVVAINGACHFHSVDTGIAVNYLDGFNFSGNIMRDITAVPISIANSSKGVVLGNNIEDWDSSGAAIRVVDSDENVISKNMLNGAEDYSIETTGTSNYNEIEGNNVRGGHANDIVSAGANDIVVHNIGSTVQKGGQSSDGATDDDDYDYISIDSVTTSAEDGDINDTNNAFTSNVVALDDGQDEKDIIRVDGMYENVFFHAKSIESKTKIEIMPSLTQLTAGQQTSVMPVGNGDAYEIWPNLYDDLTDKPWAWEENPAFTFNLAAGAAAEAEGNIDIWGNKTVFKVEIVANSGGSRELDWARLGYGDFGTQPLTTTDSYIRDTNISTAGTNVLDRIFLYRTSDDPVPLYVRIKGAVAGAGDAQITVNVYRIKRDVDI